jgi:hypothetical protein
VQAGDVTGAGGHRRRRRHGAGGAAGGDEASGGDTGRRLRDGDAGALALAAAGRRMEGAGVSQAFPSWTRSILTEIYLCHACSYHVLRTETPGQGRPGAAAAAGQLSY